MESYPESRVAEMEMGPGTKTLRSSVLAATHQPDGIRKVVPRTSVS